MTAKSTVSIQEVHALAQLANLTLTDEQAQQMQQELTSILSFVAQLDEVPTENLEPTYQVTGLVNVTRADEIIDYNVTPAQLLQNAPDVEGTSLKVKRVL